MVKTHGHSEVIVTSEGTNLFTVLQRVRLWLLKDRRSHGLLGRRRRPSCTTGTDQMCAASTCSRS